MQQVWKPLLSHCSCYSERKKEKKKEKTYVYLNDFETLSE